MPFYRSIVNHGEFHPGEVVEIAAEQVAEWKGEIELGFLVPEYLPGAVLGAPWGDVAYDVRSDAPAEEPDSEGDAEPVE